MTNSEEVILREGIWAERNAYAPILNAQRREWFDSVKECLVCRAEFRPSPPPNNFVELANYASQLQNVAAQLNNIGYPHHMGAQAWPFI